VIPRAEIAARAKGRRVHHLYGCGIADGEGFAALRASYGEIRIGRFAVRTVNHLDGTWRGNFKVELSSNRRVLCNWQRNRGSEIASQRGPVGSRIVRELRRENSGSAVDGFELLRLTGVWGYVKSNGPLSRAA
jgi:hypothetical protein